MKKYNRKMRRLFPLLDFLEFSLVRGLMALINLLPISAATWLAERIADLLFVLLGKRREIALENLALAFGSSLTWQQRRRIALGSFRHLAISLMEYFRLPKFYRKAKVQVLGSEYLEQAFRRGKGVILEISHLGPWEYLVFLSYLKKYPTTVLGRPVRNPYFYRWIKNLRKMMELGYSDKTMGAREMFAELRRNHMVAITIDQWAGNEGIWVDFFNLPTLTTSLPARLAKKTGAALVPANCLRAASGKYQIVVQPEVVLDETDEDWVVEMTEKLNQLLEEKIRTFPEQWLWAHRRWKKRKIS